MLGLFRRHRPEAVPVPPTQAAASALATHGARKRSDAARQRRRDMADQIRADLRAKGIDAPALEWPPL